MTTKPVLAKIPANWDTMNPAQKYQYAQGLADLIYDQDVTKAITPGGRIGDASHFSTSTTSNWVARTGGLPTYVLEVAHALIRSGHPESEAIHMAVGILQNWAHGGGKVSAKVRAAAAAAVAEFHAKAKAAKVESDAKLAKADVVAAMMVALREEGHTTMLSKDFVHRDRLRVEAISKKKYDTAQRRALASQGKALPDGSYPIDDEEDLNSAAVLARSGHGDVNAAKKLIARRATALGVKNPLAD